MLYIFLYIYIERKKQHLKNEAYIPCLLSITFITMTFFPIFKKCEFICDLFFMKETI